MQEVGKGMQQRPKDDEQQTSAEAGPEGKEKQGGTSKTGQKNRADKKQTPACQAKDSRLPGPKIHSPQLVTYANALSNPSILQCL